MTWVFGFTYFANGAEWVAVIFAILNSFQGFFILLFHVILNEKAKQEFTRHSKSNYRYFKVDKVCICFFCNVNVKCKFGEHAFGIPHNSEQIVSNYSNLFSE